MTEYRIDFSITRRQAGEADFTEIGFGSSGAWGDLGACTHEVESVIVNGVWETAAGMPDPSEITGGAGTSRG